ncbi:Hsp20/alpha crystallin family protein [Aneurinibacillus sp. Ricciae_BoGa-3]|uniref:Hsp20/alpha crystallin family protein n=1 Tax=Aneurinibacillus sp. Ricciae_BoGa-3 TaxID=3022697 RepID=UPI0023418E06|nr:Hsp20/alpha crystallin family protein [Aneurinibacillus sp. Ricciae_BoGa-3]WCK52686.1 Hsp20/alpha crystallin family protein [Aneurinibacillus sp. Ricciae_BoGa-3]
MGNVFRRNDNSRPSLFRINEELGSLVDNIFKSSLFPDTILPSFGRNDWAPRLSVEETDKEYLISAEVPGIDPSSIQVEIQGQTLSIKGEKSNEAEEKSKNYHIMERSYGSFYRSLTLPDGADLDNIQARSKHGVLTLTIPKKEQLQSKRISIDVEE